MIKLQYAILGSIIPMFVVFHYSNNIIDELYNEINTLKNNGYGECFELQEFDVTVTTYNPTRRDPTKPLLFSGEGSNTTY